MPLTALVDREGRIAISHAGVVDPLVFETDMKAATDKKYPVDLTKTVELAHLGESIPYAEMLCQAACFLLCQVLQREI